MAELDILDKRLSIPAWEVPLYRYKVARDFKVDKRLAFVTYGGLGDILNCEPSVRYACEVLKPGLGLESISVATKAPEIFSHLPVEIIKLNVGTNAIDDGHKKYHWLYFGHKEGNFQHFYFTHNSMLPVDYPALSALRQQLPLEYRYIKQATDTVSPPPGDSVYIHAGDHWDSKSFPKEWWNSVIQGLRISGFLPVLIGMPPNPNRMGTVDVDTTGCLDLRGKMSIKDTASHLKEADILITNDSFPLHLAAIGKCWIGFLATAKDPEWLYHFRRTPSGKIEFAWRMEDLALGGAYQRSLQPQAGGSALSEATVEEVMKWLPGPEVVVQWAISRAKELKDLAAKGVLSENQG